MLVDARGRPLPPQEIQARLAQIDPALHLRFVDEGEGGWWALAETWKLGDPRYKLIQNGGMNPDDNWDLIAQLPKDCSADEAYGYLVRNLQRSAQTKEHARDMLNRIHLYNKQRSDSVMKESMDYADEVLDANAPTLFQDFGKTTTKFFVTDKRKK